jgi:hypothetical protein
LKELNHIDLFAFVETQLENPLSDYPDLRKNMTFLPNNLLEQPKKHGGLLVAGQQCCLFLQYFCSHGLEALSFTYRNLKLILLHRHPKSPNDIFQLALDDMLTCFPHDKTIVFGDFNVDVKESPNSQTTEILRRHELTQLVDFPTTIYNTTIDHVWVSKALSVQVHHVQTYHSDHFPIMLRILV